MKRTHKGLMFGCVPVYFDFTDDEAPGVEGRFWGCQTALDVAFFFYGCLITMATMVNPEYDPEFTMVITGVLDWDGGEIE